MCLLLCKIPKINSRLTDVKTPSKKSANVYGILHTNNILCRLISVYPGFTYHLLQLFTVRLDLCFANLSLHIFVLVDCPIVLLSRAIQAYPPTGLGSPSEVRTRPIV